MPFASASRACPAARASATERRAKGQCHQRPAPHGCGERVVPRGTGVRLGPLRSRCGQRGMTAHPAHVGLEESRPCQADIVPAGLEHVAGGVEVLLRTPRVEPPRVQRRPSPSPEARTPGSAGPRMTPALLPRRIASFPRPAVTSGYALANRDSSRWGSPSGRSSAARWHRPQTALTSPRSSAPRAARERRADARRARSSNRGSALSSSDRLR